MKCQNGCGDGGSGNSDYCTKDGALFYEQVEERVMMDDGEVRFELF